MISMLLSVLQVLGLCSVITLIILMACHLCVCVIIATKKEIAYFKRWLLEFNAGGGNYE